MDKDNDGFTIPEYATELIQALDETFPPTTPSINESEREIFVRVGQRELVEFLKERLRDQEEFDYDPLEDN